MLNNCEGMAVLWVCTSCVGRAVLNNCEGMAVFKLCRKGCTC